METRCHKIELELNIRVIEKALETYRGSSTTQEKAFKNAVRNAVINLDKT